MFKIKTCDSGNKPVDVLETVCESLWSSGNLSIFISSSVNLIHQFCYYNELQGKTEHEFSRNLKKTAIPAQVNTVLNTAVAEHDCQRPMMYFVYHPVTAGIQPTHSPEVHR